MPDTFSIDALSAWLAAHPGWAGLAVFLVAFTESLAIVGLFMPGTVLMFAIGALVALDALALWPTLILAALGAVAGDGLSYWLGRRYHMQLKVMWPFRRYPRLMARGVDFFHAHGGKSVLMARFFGPVRPILPAVAGMLEMPPGRFLLVNVISALLWAPAYLLPGLVFGASLELAAEVAARLMLLLALGLALVWFSLWLVLRVTRYLQARAEANIARLWRWSRHHPWLGRISTALIDPDHPEARALAWLGLILLGAAWAFFFTLWQVIGQNEPLTLDLAVYRFFQGLRTPATDRLMVFVTQFGDSAVYLPAALALFAWLLWRRRLSAALHWAAASGFGLLLTQSLKLGLQVPRPGELYSGVSAFAFPSGHALMSTTVYGFLAVLAARELPPRARRWAYLGATLVIVPVAFSRLYLGAHWLSDVIGGLCLGLATVSLLGLAYRRHPAPPLALTPALSLFLVVLAAGLAWHGARQFGQELERYAYRPARMVMTTDAWWQSGWQRLPLTRHDLRGRAGHPLNLQWAVDLETTRRFLSKRGWQPATPLNPETALRLLAPDLPVMQLPVLPQVHDGRHEVLRWVRPQGEALLVLRLWETPFELGDLGHPLRVGNVSRLHRHSLGPIRYLATGQDFSTPLEQLLADLPARDVARRSGDTGYVWLVRQVGNGSDIMF